MEWAMVIIRKNGYLSKQWGRPSAGGSHMSGVWGREKPRQASPRKSAERLLRTHDLVTQ